ncbi:hypothetical protein [Bradyrhizobium sp. CCBAU 53421]|uniref:hypothetical protein n=1 Tax=Bradyrhizobium sp. CCBAU 53421 TaxID=1325120 RepID=UPI001FEFC925|nr:hypothetical protein [Bradyrhizobium sp. CCBAU 53421]
MTSIRLSVELRTAIDAWAADQSDSPVRTEAIRRLVEIGLASATAARPKSESQRQRARDMADKAIDKIADSTASSEEQADRKRQLVKGPAEFQKVRRDRNRK